MDLRKDVEARGNRLRQATHTQETHKAPKTASGKGKKKRGDRREPLHPTEEALLGQSVKNTQHTEVVKEEDETCSKKQKLAGEGKACPGEISETPGKLTQSMRAREDEGKNENHEGGGTKKGLSKKQQILIAFFSDG